MDGRWVKILCSQTYKGDGINTVLKQTCINTWLGWDDCIKYVQVQVKYAFQLSMFLDICVVVLVGANVVGEKG